MTDDANPEYGSANNFGSSNADTSDLLMPSELRWLLSKRESTEPNYDLLLRCLATMDHNMKEMQRLRAFVKAAQGFAKRVEAEFGAPNTDDQRDDFDVEQEEFLAALEVCLGRTR